MAETMTYDAGTDTVTTSENLTPDEQNSLEVGTEMQNQQENLLAGKYKNAQELEKAYAELEAKLGSQTTDTQPEKAETSTDTKADDSTGYLEDGSVDYGEVNETYGDQLGELFKSNNIAPWAISTHFHENQGSITDEMFSQLESAGLSKATINCYLEGRAVQAGYTETGDSSEVADLSESDANSIKNSVGGEDAYNQMTQWAAANLDQKVIEAFDGLLDTGNAGAIQLAVNGLKAEYENATGYEGRMYSGKPPASSGDVFRSQPELVEAMSDPRYDRDPAYRQDVIEKLDRSDLSF